MEKPLVSVVIPAYNGEKYLDETIQSVIAQTYPNWELLIVDDGSKDGTAAIGKRWAAQDARVTYIYQANQGMASARNAGIEKAKGKYVAFLDHDNLFLPKKLELQVAHLEANPGVGLSYARILHFYNDAPTVLYTNKNETPYTGDDLFRECLHRNFMNVLAVLVRKDVFEKYGAFHPGWYACDEQYVWINLAYHGVRFAYLDEVVGHLRLHLASDSARKDYLVRSGTYFLKMFAIVESWLTPLEKKKYGPDIVGLRRQWQVKRFIGTLMNTAPFSWILMPLFLARRDRNFERIG